jgi:hypothetical protein
MINTHTVSGFSLDDQEELVDAPWDHINPGHPCIVSSIALDTSCQSGIAAHTQLQGCDTWLTIDYSLIFGPPPPKVVEMLRAGKEEAAMKWVSTNTLARKLNII